MSGGLIQRLTIVIGWGWLALVAVHLLRSGTSDGAISD